jgi:hypothetical protein
MSNKTKLTAALALLTLVACVIVPVVSAKDYSQLEKTSESLLTDPSYKLGVLAPVVHISTAEVTINYIGISTTTADIGKDVGGMLGIYWAIVNNSPEVGDLLITDEDINGKAVSTFNCPKEWVSGMDIQDASATQRLALKVLLTIKTA